MRSATARRYSSSRSSAASGRSASVARSASANCCSFTSSRSRPISDSSGAAMYAIVPQRAKIARPAASAYVSARVSSELIAERAREYPWPQWCLGGDELLGADKGAGVRIGQVLAGKRETPGILRDLDRCVVGRVGRVLEAASRGTHGSAEVVGRIRTRL